MLSLVSATVPGQVIERSMSLASSAMGPANQAQHEMAFNIVPWCGARADADSADATCVYTGPVMSKEGCSVWTIVA